jgi:hypothetical protein
MSFPRNASRPFYIGNIPFRKKNFINGQFVERTIPGRVACQAVALREGLEESLNISVPLGLH